MPSSHAFPKHLPHLLWGAHQHPFQATSQLAHRQCAEQAPAALRECAVAEGVSAATCCDGPQRRSCVASFGPPNIGHPTACVQPHLPRLPCPVCHRTILVPPPPPAARWTVLTRGCAECVAYGTRGGGLRGQQKFVSKKMGLSFLALHSKSHFLRKSVLVFGGWIRQSSPPPPPPGHPWISTSLLTACTVPPLLPP